MTKRPKEANNEAIWFWINTSKDNAANLMPIFAYPQSGNAKAAGTCPTQNFVDKFETENPGVKLHLEVIPRDDIHQVVETDVELSE